MQKKQISITAKPQKKLFYQTSNQLFLLVIPKRSALKLGWLRYIVICWLPSWIKARLKRSVKTATKQQIKIKILLTCDTAFYHSLPASHAAAASHCTCLRSLPMFCSGCYYVSALLPHRGDVRCLTKVVVQEGKKLLQEYLPETSETL